jgi:hypothetical protein
MPEISRFLGIVISMHFNDHAPPHFQAKYGDDVASFSIHDLMITEGKLPKRIVSYVLEWAFEHREELLPNWKRIEERKPLAKIEPLV